MPMEDARRDGGTVAAGAMDCDGAIARNLGDAFLQMIERNVDASGDVPGGPFARIADVEDERWVGGELSVEGAWG